MSPPPTSRLDECKLFAASSEAEAHFVVPPWSEERYIGEVVKESERLRRRPSDEADRLCAMRWHRHGSVVFA